MMHKHFKVNLLSVLYLYRTTKFARHTGHLGVYCIFICMLHLGSTHHSYSTKFSNHECQISNNGLVNAFFQRTIYLYEHIIIDHIHLGDKGKLAPEESIQMQGLWWVTSNIDPDLLETSPCAPFQKVGLKKALLSFDIERDVLCLSTCSRMYGHLLQSPHVIPLTLSEHCCKFFQDTAWKNLFADALHMYPMIQLLM